MLSYEGLKRHATNFLAATGLRQEEFEALLSVFSAVYARAYPTDLTWDGQPRKHKWGGGSKGQLHKDEDKLLFILVYTKTYSLQAMHGMHFGMSQPQANYWIHRLLPVLQAALDALKMTPERDGTKVSSHPSVTEVAADLLLDGTERERQRPKDYEKQAEHYSGKQKTHTDKNILLVHEHTRKIVYLGPTCVGRIHDKKAADQANICYPPNATLTDDTGFLGYAPPGVLIYQPTKKPKGKPLSDDDKDLNRFISTVRIQVEHAIAGIKRCRIVKDILRNFKADVSDMVMSIACALHNLRVTFRYATTTYSFVQ